MAAEVAASRMEAKYVDIDSACVWQKLRQLQHICVSKLKFGFS